MKHTNTPILLIVYNRPEIVQKLLKALNKIKPIDVFVFCDGPKTKADRLLVTKTRKLFKELPWACNVTRKFQKNNLGCQKGVSSAISWFFENVPQGIILEDDCIPNKSFFNFTASLLKKYKNDTRISMISGSNLGFKNCSNDSYFYSKYSMVWGWATWKNEWKAYDKHYNYKTEKLFSKNNTQICRRLGINNKFISNVKKAHQGKLDSWAYLWSYFNLIENRLSVIPKYNLIKNIGFGNEATHTKIKTSLSELKKENMSKDIKHPVFLVSNYKFDLYVEKTDKFLYILFDAIRLQIKKYLKKINSF